MSSQQLWSKLYSAMELVEDGAGLPPAKRPRLECSLESPASGSASNSSDFAVHDQFLSPGSLGSSPHAPTCSQAPLANPATLTGLCQLYNLLSAAAAAGVQLNDLGLPSLEALQALPAALAEAYKYQQQQQAAAGKEAQAQQQASTVPMPCSVPRVNAHHAANAPAACAHVPAPIVCNQAAYIGPSSNNAEAATVCAAHSRGPQVISGSVAGVAPQGHHAPSLALAVPQQQQPQGGSGPSSVISVATMDTSCPPADAVMNETTSNADSAEEDIGWFHRCRGCGQMTSGEHDVCGATLPMCRTCCRQYASKPAHIQKELSERLKKVDQIWAAKKM